MFARLLMFSSDPCARLQAAAAGGLQRADATNGGRVVPLLRGAQQLQEVLSAAGISHVYPTIYMTPILHETLVLALNPKT